MPAHPFQTNFTAGELTEKLDARVDFARYRNGAKCLQNFMPQPHGGAGRRAGTFFVAQAKDSSDKIRLAKFEFSTAQAYILEFGRFYIRFFTDRAPVTSGGVPVEVTTPYDWQHLFELRFAQSADVLYIAHPSYPVQKLQRTSATAFTLTPVNFDPPPTTEQPILPAADLTLSAITGSGVTATASAPAFLNADVGRIIRAGVGRASITAFVSTTQVTVDVIDDFSSVGPHPSGSWEIQGSPNTTLTPSAKEPKNAIVTLTLGIAGWRTSDVGSFVLVHGGMVEITSYSSTTVVSGRILSVLSAVTAAPGGSWTLEVAAWSSALGFPGVLTFHQDRLWFFGNANQPDSGWGSVIGDYENFAAGADDDNAVFFTIAEGGVNLIRWAVPLTATMAIGTVAGEFTLTGGGVGDPITATNVQVVPQSTYGGSFPVDALRVGSVAIFLQRGDRNVREMAFNFEADAFVAPDISILAEHLFRDGITQMAAIQSPQTILFAIVSTGTLLACAYERPENVIAWSRHVTDGFYESVATMPNACASGDEVWVSVRRIINGTTRRYIEAFDGAMDVDAGLVYSGPPVVDVLGFSHLEAESLEVKDGTADMTLVVTAGKITLPSASGNVQAGLGFDSTLVTLRPEIETRMGTSQGRRRHWNEAVVRWYCTEGTPEITRGGPDQRENWELPPGEVRPYTGDTRMLATGWDHLAQDGRITVEQRTPYRCTVLGITGSFDVDDG